MGLDTAPPARRRANRSGWKKEFSYEEREEMFENDYILHVYTVGGFEERLDGLGLGSYRIQGESMHLGRFGLGNNWWREICLSWPSRSSPRMCGRTRSNTRAGRFSSDHVSDWEGCIGPATSKKLAEDFRCHAAKAEAYARACAGGNRNRGNEDDSEIVHPWWLETYQEWRQAFEVAGDDGFVQFHGARKAPLPPPPPRSGEGEERSGSPSPLRGGGWGEGLLSQPLNEEKARPCRNNESTPGASGKPPWRRPIRACVCAPFCPRPRFAARRLCNRVDVFWWLAAARPAWR